MTWLPGVHFETPDPVPEAAWVLDRFTGPYGLYVHIPFCRTLCPFCPYNKVRYDPQLATEHARALLGEFAAYLAAGAGPFTSVYVGGGTPTLCLDVVGEVLDTDEVTGERAIEVLPSDLTDGLAQELEGLGFDAISVGVQSFDPAALAHLRRPTTVRQNRAAVEVAMAHFRSVDVDLIFDTAFERPETLLTDLEVCFRAGVDQVSTYPLMRFGYTPFGKAAHTPDVEHRLLRDATELAAAHGYERRAVWTFNRVGGPTYTSITRERYLGVGASAATFTGTVFLVDHFGLEPYVEAVAAGRLPIARLARMRPLSAGAYGLFWQLYTGAVPAGFVERLPGGRRLLRLALAVGRAVRWLDADAGGLRLTAGGYDRYHDLERWVTYQMIEPLWAELMREHELAGGGPSPARLDTAA
jgi:menaquinone C8-methyltransferase